METVNISITRAEQYVLIKSSEGQQIKILDSNKVLKATEIINFLMYEKNKKYVVNQLTEEIKNDKNVLSIYEIFDEIVQKLNPIEE